jgi:hypothetical protein
MGGRNGNTRIENLCGVHYPPEIFTRTEYYPFGEGPLVEIVREAIRNGVEIKIIEPKYVNTERWALFY